MEQLVAAFQDLLDLVVAATPKVLIGIGLVWGGSIFLGTADALDIFFDGLGIFWIVKGIYKMIS